MPKLLSRTRALPRIYRSVGISMVAVLAACGGTDEDKERDAKRNAAKGCESMTQQADGACDSKPAVVGTPKNTI